MGINRTWKLAELVLGNLEILFDDMGLDGYANPYHNGRENGFCVQLTLSKSKTGGRVAYFSNVRNRSGIAVYQMFNGRTDGIDDEAYRSSHSFDESDSYAAAKFIMDWLVS